MNTREVILKAREKGKCVPAFNVPHIPMVKPIIEAIRDENSVAMIQVARGVGKNESRISRAHRGGI